jgi:hypothetical protein
MWRVIKNLNVNVEEIKYKRINRLTNKIGKDLISNSFGIGYGIIEK